jgi:ABC-type lipoprotein release transport system permease subunit
VTEEGQARPESFLVATLAIALAAAVAALAPLRRATSTDPAAVLRGD